MIDGENSLSLLDCSAIQKQSWSKCNSKHRNILLKKQREEQLSVNTG